MANLFVRYQGPDCGPIDPLVVPYLGPDSGPILLIFNLGLIVAQ